MTDHLHAMTLVNQLKSLIDKKAVMRFTQVASELNNLYEEGIKAHKLGHFAERHFVDLTFGSTCDDCGIDIEFLLFICLGCRNHSICEKCYFRQLDQENDNDSDIEHAISNELQTNHTAANALLNSDSE